MIPLWSFFFIGCLIGLIVMLAARILGKFPQLMEAVFGSLGSRIDEADEGLHQWHEAARKFRDRELERFRHLRDKK